MHTMSQAAESRLQSEPLARTILHHLCQFLHAEPGSHLDLTGLQGGKETVVITARIPVSLYRHLEAFDADGDPDSEPSLAAPGRMISKLKQFNPSRWQKVSQHHEKRSRIGNRQGIRLHRPALDQDGRAWQGPRRLPAQRAGRQMVV